MKDKAALYIRVSTHHQIDKDSLPFQKQELINYAKYALNIEDYVIFDDPGYSAKNTKRPKYQEMMQRVRSGEFTHLIVWKIDRISRNLRDFTEMYDELKERNVTFVSKNEQFDTSSAMGEAMLKIILVFAELERDMTAERVFNIMISRAEKGLWNGATVPLGYIWDDETKFPAVCPKESKIVKYIYELYSNNGSTLQTASILNAERIPTKRGGTWVAKTVRDILRNPFYIGTYRYNMRDSSKGKYTIKDQNEWILLENNHEAIIDAELFHKVGGMLSRNYRGLDAVRRENTNIHIFAKKLYCSHCGQIMTSGLDTKRKDGYRPSRYVCSSYHSKGVKSYCNNFISDITLGPFMINYVANLINLQDTITDKYSIKKIEKSLLRGNMFGDVLGINDESLKETYSMLVSGYASESYDKDLPEVQAINLDQERVKREIEKHKKALDRLNDLYLYDDDGISKKDYITKKNEISGNLEDAEDRLNESLSQSNNIDVELFIDKAQFFLISKELQQGKQVEFRNFLDLVGQEVLADFMASIIDDVKVEDKRVSQITFKNGITHKFVHKPLVTNKAASYKYPANGAYRSHFNLVLEYVKEHGSVTRPQVEELAGIKRHSALTLLNELISMNKLEKRRESVSTKYFLKEI